MEIDRKMARYLLEIKRSLPRAQQSQFNLSSPHIEKIVMAVHKSTKNTKVKVLAAAFLEQASKSRLLEGHYRQERKQEQRQERVPAQLMERQPITKSVAKPTLEQRPARATNRPTEVSPVSLNNSAKKPQPTLVVVNNSTKNLQQEEPQHEGILPEFLENLDISELPPLAGSSSSKQTRRMNATATLKTSRPVTEPAKHGTAILDKVAIFLTTPLELSMPIKFAKRRTEAAN